MLIEDRGSSFWRDASGEWAVSLTRADEAEEDVRANLQRRTNVPADKLFAFSPAGIDSYKSSAVIFSVRQESGRAVTRDRSYIFVIPFTRVSCKLLEFS